MFWVFYVLLRLWMYLEARKLKRMSSRSIMLKNICVFVKSCLKIFILKEKRPKNLVRKPASEGLPQFSYLPCPFSHHLSKHLMKQKMFLKWWARWTFLPQQFWSIMPIPSPHSKATAVLKAGFARTTYAWRKGLRFSGEERKEQEPTSLLFTKERKKEKSHKTTPLEKASEEVTTQGLVHPTARPSVTKQSKDILTKSVFSKLGSSLQETTCHLETL